MPNIDSIVGQLLSLPQRDYSNVIKRVDAERRRVLEQKEREHPARPGMSRDEYASWLAGQHYAIDKGISRIIYLPAGSPDKEVRLLEVNELAHIPESAPIEAFDFGPDVEGLNFSVFVADVTPRQLDQLEQQRIPLPEGWTLEGA